MPLPSQRYANDKSGFLSVYGGLVPLGYQFPIPINLRLYMIFSISYHNSA